MAKIKLFSNYLKNLLMLVGSGDLRQMSEYPIPHGEHYDSCILRRSCKPAFLHPEEGIQGLIDLPQG
jgi:hypothetical protein